MHKIATQFYLYKNYTLIHVTRTILKEDNAGTPLSHYFPTYILHIHVQEILSCFLIKG